MRALFALALLVSIVAAIAAPRSSFAQSTDTDGDGLADWIETAIGTDAYVFDTDGDTHGDGLELMAQSDPFDPNSVPAGPVTDHPGTYCCDGLTYGDAAAIHTYPWAFNSDVDSDGDGLTDAEEMTWSTDPDNPDTDGDYRLDDDEVHSLRPSNPFDLDSDGDGLLDGEDPDPTYPDADGDDYDDGVEVAAGSDPWDPNSIPAASASASDTSYPATDTPVTSLPNTGAGIWVDPGSSLNAGLVATLGLAFILASLCLVPRFRRIGHVTPQQPSTHDARVQLSATTKEVTAMSSTPIRRTILVATLVVAAFTAIHGAVGAQPSDDYTGDYSASYWIYANPEPTPWQERLPRAELEFVITR